MEASFSGKVALVTGAGSGIGRAAALLYAAHGAHVLVSDIDNKGGEETVRMIKEKGGAAHFEMTDVSKEKQCEQLVRNTVKQFGRLDIAFNNAGIGGEANPVGSMSIDGWDKVIAVNLSSVFYCMRYEIPAMLEQGGGVIVNMASILGWVGFANSAAYVAAKHGVVGLSQNAALEYATQNIRVNAVGPGFISTPLLDKAHMDDAVKKMLVSLHPMGRLGRAEEVAELVLWLSSEKSSFVTGSYYPVDGGYLSR